MLPRTASPLLSPQSSLPTPPTASLQANSGVPSPVPLYTNTRYLHHDSALVPGQLKIEYGYFLHPSFPPAPHSFSILTPAGVVFVATALFGLLTSTPITTRLAHSNMWLLSTDRAELRYFARNFDAEGGYAILSHTWDENEQSFRQVRAIAEQCHRDGTNPRDFVDTKIRECCILAEKHGYHWVWIDSCCIDKTSSSELSEAINSMYKWYKSSEVCYAYLKDVPSDDILESPNSAFWNSRWHTRGWTLQELIAPDSVIFLSKNWRELGNRAELALLLHRITRIPIGLLLGVTRPAQYFACVDPTTGDISRWDNGPWRLATSLATGLRPGAAALDEKAGTRRQVASDDMESVHPRHHHVRRTWDGAAAEQANVLAIQ